MANRGKFKDRAVFGGSGDVGYIAKKPGHGKAVEEMLERNLGRREEDARNLKQLKRSQYYTMQTNFWAQSTHHDLRVRMNELVDLAMKAREEDVGNKRDRLKVMMLTEQLSLTEEYTDKALKRGDVEYEIKKKKAAEIENKKADSQDAYVKSAYDRIFKESCQELREKIHEENLRNDKRIQEMQIQEKCLARELLQEEERVWWEEMRKEDELPVQRSIEEETETCRMAKEYILGLDHQTEFMKRVRKNADCIERNEERFRAEYRRMKDNEWNDKVEKKRQEQKIYNQDLLHQIETNRLMRLRSKKEDDSVGKILYDEDLKAAQREKAAYVDNTIQLRKELMFFKESLEQYRHATRTLERDAETAAYEQFASAENQKIAARIEKKKLNKDVCAANVEALKRQQFERNEMENQTKRREALQAEFEQFRIAENLNPFARDEMRTNEPDSWKLRNAQIDEENKRFKTMLSERERLEDKLYFDRTRDEYDRKLDRLLNQPQIFSTGSSVHPFAHLVLPATQNS